MGSTAPLRIAILEADTPLPSTRAKYGSYGGVFTSLLHKGADLLSIPRDGLEITGWDVVNVKQGREVVQEEECCGGMYNWKSRRGYPELGGVDGVLITGSRFNAFDDDAWIIRLVEFTKTIIAHPRVRIIGVCFGHQIVGRALGAKVARNDRAGWEASVCQVQQTEKGRELFGGKNVLNIFQMHKDIVYHYPSGLEELGSSDRCQVQGMYIPKRLITVQGHPEFTEEIVRELLVARHEQGIFDDDVFDDAIGRVADEQDGVLVAAAFLRFLRE
ncbi:MAG: hypothetical protein Q9217_005613 [Psora testacea]